MWYRRGARSTAQGFIGLDVIGDANTAVVIEVNCETDFVAKTDIFRNGVLTYLETLHHSKDTQIPMSKKDDEELKKKFLSTNLIRSLDPDMKQMTGSEGLTYLISKTRENCNIGNIIRHESKQNERFGSYLHGATNDNLCKVGSLVLMSSTNYEFDCHNIANTIAMHIVASTPKFITKAQAESSGEKFDNKDILMNQELIAPDNVENMLVMDWLSMQSERNNAELKIEDFSIFNCS